MAINRDKVYDGAMKLLAAGKFDKGIAELQKLIADEPKDVRTLLKIAETLHVKMGKRKEALDSYDRAATIYAEQGFFFKAVAVFKQMLSVDATSPELHLRLAELYQQMGYSSQCLLHYQQVVVLFEQQGRGKETLSILKRMVDLDPENLQSRVKVAELFHQQGMVTEAVTEMRQAFAFLRTQQRFDDALRVGEKVAAWDPNAVDIARELGTIYMQRGDAKNALAKLQLCFRLAPRDLEILGLIANAFLALDQMPKTISVYKEMARIYESNDDAGQARSHWQRVLDLAPGDEDAEIALGRRKADAVAAAPSAAPTTPRLSPEDDQLSRLMTETDVYVKYGLRDKAIEHLDKIFALRPEYLPALEKLRQLQNQTQQKAAAADTLRLMVSKGKESGHPRLAEWQEELARLAPNKPTAPTAPQVPPAPPVPPRKPAREVAADNDLMLVDDVAGRRSAPVPVAAPVAQKPPPSIRGGRPPVGIVSLEDEPLDPVPPVAAPKPTALPERPKMALLPADESFEDIGREERLAARNRPDVDDEFNAPTLMAVGPLPMVPPLPSFAGGQMMGIVAPTPARVPTARRPEVVLDEPAGAFEADADELVREALGMPPPPSTGSFPSVRGAPGQLWGASNGNLPGLAPPLGSEEGMAADELVFDAVAAGRYDDDDSSMLDALAAQAVSDAAKNDAGNELFSGDEMGSLAAFAAAVPDASPLPPGSTFGNDDNHNTIVYPGPSWGAQGVAGLDNGPNVAGVYRAPAVAIAGNLVSAPSLPSASAQPAPARIVAALNEFEDFELPDDVKAVLSRTASSASSILRAEPDGFNALDPQATAAFHRHGAASIDDELNDSFGQSFGDVPSLASTDADAIVEVPASPLVVSPPDRAPVANVVDDNDHAQMSAARELFAPTHGFEDDPANTFFPDELAEAEFFIQQDLLDEAREILEPILEEIDDSERVKHMLARVAAKEAGEPEPPAPWEQRLIDDVAAELDNMSMPPAPALEPGQISVEEVLSQFKRGVAETVPEDDAATHYDLGIAYREMGLLEDAVGEFKVASRAASKAPDALFLIGLVRLEQGRSTDALDALRAAVEAPAATKAQRAAAEYQRAVIFADVEGDGAAGLLAFKRSKSLGGSAPDLERRITQLVAIHGDLDSTASSRTQPDTRQKNIDYV